MSDNLQFAVTALIFVSVAVAAAAICYRLVYSRKPGQGDPAPSMPQLPPPIAPGSPVPPYATPSDPQFAYASAPAPAAPSKARSWSGDGWSIHDQQSARKAARPAMWAAFYVAIVTGVLAFLAGCGLQMFQGVGPMAWVDAVIFAGLGIGIGKMSRVAAIGALLLYIAERIAMARSVGLNQAMMIAMVACFAQGIRGTWAFHKFRPQ